MTDQATQVSFEINQLQGKISNINRRIDLLRRNKREEWAQSMHSTVVHIQEWLVRKASDADRERRLSNAAMLLNKQEEWLRYFDFVIESGGIEVEVIRLRQEQDNLKEKMICLLNAFLATNV